jgi:phosphinothricin acetyltransferase
MVNSDNSIAIRDVKPDDVETIIEIYAPYILDGWTSFEEEVPDSQEMWERIEYYSDEYPWLVAEADNRVIGYAYANAYRTRPAYRWTAEVSVYISPEWHGRNVARQLYDAIFGLLQAQNIRQVLAGVTLPNDKSEGFHKKMGFAEIGVYSDVGYKFGKWHSVRWYEKTLNENDPPEEFVPYPELEW